jgi:hypothetical protein
MMYNLVIAKTRYTKLSSMPQSTQIINYAYAFPWQVPRSCQRVIVA